MIIKTRRQIWIHYCYQFERCKTSTTEHNKRVVVFLITQKCAVQKASVDVNISYY